MAKKKIKQSDLNLMPKPIGSIEEASVDKTKDVVDQTFKCGNTTICEDTLRCDTYACNTLKCDATYNCNITLVSGCVTRRCQGSIYCPITDKNCETGNGCYQTGYTCPDPTLKCQLKTEQDECLTELCVEKTVFCGEATVDNPCLYTEQSECEATDALICNSTSKDCIIPDTEICDVPNTETVCLLPETRQACTALPCQLSAECNSLATSCEETSNECES